MKQDTKYKLLELEIDAMSHAEERFPRIPVLLRRARSILALLNHVGLHLNRGRLPLTEIHMLCQRLPQQTPCKVIRGGEKKK